MRTTKTDLAIVNRAFWPKSQVIGESLLQLAESVAQRKRVVVITQSEGGLQERLAQAGRGQGVRVLDILSRSDSSTGLVKRSLDAALFMFWTFASLVRTRPKVVYVSTNPPVLVPFIVFAYARIFGARYCYHLQDIHPEAANIVVKLHPFAFKLLQGLDGLVMRHADSLITLSEDMRACILARSRTRSPIYLLDNPAFEVTNTDPATRTKDFVFCGNAGRLQRIPLLLEAIAAYLDQGGRLNLCFVGAGVYAPKIKELAERYEAVTYLGFLPAAQAAEVVNQHRWALLPIDDEVTRYAFPSKSSSYVVSHCRILAICGKETSVARWVEENGIGRACVPKKEEIVQTLQEIENDRDEDCYAIPAELERKLEFKYFVAQLQNLLLID
jgi:glycosyltransferase involved in cell wall biosynthesis